MKIVVAGGGTAGHVFPALAVGEVLIARGHEVVFVGAADGQEARLIPAAGHRFVPLRVWSAQTRVSMRSVGAIATALRGAREIRGLVASSSAVLGIGGYASAPGVLAARRTRRPLVLVEQNSVPGAVNRVAARWAAAVATTFAATAPRLPSRVRVERTGNPIRPEIAAVTARRAALAVEARQVFDLAADRHTILVLGGSQGARHLDEVVAGVLPILRDRADLQLLVATGPEHLATVRDAIDPAAALRVRASGFIDRMELALAVADVAVSRSGAGHCAELTACGVPAVLVPYPHATENHQEANAREVVAAGAAELLLDTDLSPERVAACILEVMDDDGRRARMCEAGQRWARPDAAARIADLLEEVVR